MPSVCWPWRQCCKSKPWALSARPDNVLRCAKGFTVKSASWLASSVTPSCRWWSTGRCSGTGMMRMYVYKSVIYWWYPNFPILMRTIIRNHWICGYLIFRQSHVYKSMESIRAEAIDNTQPVSQHLNLHACFDPNRRPLQVDASRWKGEDMWRTKPRNLKLESRTSMTSWIPYHLHMASHPASLAPRPVASQGQWKHRRTDQWDPAPGASSCRTSIHFWIYIRSKENSALSNHIPTIYTFRNF